jgi:low temperature requirement protein LtrA
VTHPLPRSPISSFSWKSPRLRVDSDGEGSDRASWIELFFDLVFVVVIAELSHTLEEHLDWTGLIQFAGLFVPCWWAWVLVTFYVDRYETDDPLHRLSILAAMLATIFLGANVHNAFDSGAIGFVLSYVAIRSIVLVLYWRATRYVRSALSNLKLYLASYLPSTSLWIASIAFSAPTRYWMWGMAMAIELLIPILGTRILARTPNHPSHLQERFGLFTLIVLGESIVSVASATANGSWNLWATGAAIAGFGIAACLWWLYFNFLETAVAIRGIGSVHVFNYGHLPIVMGLALTAVGTKQAIAEAAKGTVLAGGARWALLGGVALSMSAIAMITVFGCRKRFSWQMVGTIALVLGLAILGQNLLAIALEGLLLLLLMAKVSRQVMTTQFNNEEKVSISFGDSDR